MIVNKVVLNAGRVEESVLEMKVLEKVLESLSVRMTWRRVTENDASEESDRNSV